MPLQNISRTPTVAARYFVVRGRISLCSPCEFVGYALRNIIIDCPELCKCVCIQHYLAVSVRISFVDCHSRIGTTSGHKRMNGFIYVRSLPVPNRPQASEITPVIDTVIAENSRARSVLTKSHAHFPDLPDSTTCPMDILRWD